jgi:hypothetical protein
MSEVNSPAAKLAGVIPAHHDRRAAMQWFIEHRRDDVTFEQAIRTLRFAFHGNRQAQRLIDELTPAPQDNGAWAVPATQNEGWGFWGTMGGYASVAWPLAMTAIAETSGEDVETVRAFLDSRCGRHFANEVQNELDGADLPKAIAATVKIWMDRPVSRQTSREWGILQGLPSLTGYVIHCGIEAGTEASHG